MIEAMLEFRAKVCLIYQKFQYALNLIFKFAVSFLVITTLNTEIGYDPRFAAPGVVMMMSIICAFTPGGVLALMCLLVTVIHVYSVNIALAVFVGLIMIILYAFFLRFTPRYAYIMIAIPVLGVFNIPYTVPLLAGLTTSPATIFPMCCGIFFRYLIAIIRNCVGIQVDLTKLNTDNLLELVNAIVDNLLNSKEMLWFMGVYAMVEFVVFLIRKLKFSFSFEISIIVGTAACILGHVFIDGKYPLNGGIGKMLMFSLISGGLVMIVYAFLRILDYTAVENVQFEDDDYYYYVRAVPKIKSGLKKLNIRKMDAPTYFESSMESEAFEDDPFTDPKTGEVLEPEKFMENRRKHKPKEAKKAEKGEGRKLPAFLNFKREKKQEQKPESKVVIEEPDEEHAMERVPGEKLDKDVKDKREVKEVKDAKDKKDSKEKKAVIEKKDE